MRRALGRLRRPLHARGLVHCDLHPSNVLVQPEGLDFPIVIDLGFVAFLLGAPDLAARLPGPTVSLAQPAVPAPELQLALDLAARGRPAGARGTCRGARTPSWHRFRRGRR